MNTDDTRVKVEGLSKKFCRNLKRSMYYGLHDLGRELTGKEPKKAFELRKEEFWALQNINFSLDAGDCLALIGHNGAGKTTLLKLLNGLIKPSSGIATIYGKVGALIALGAGFNPILTGRENIYINAAILGYRKKDVERKLDEIIAFSELEKFIDSPVQNYSSGMHARLGFSIAASFRPDVLLVDEVLAVGDISFTIKCLNRIAKLRRQGAAVIFVSHNEHQVRDAAQRFLVLDHGKSKYFDDVDEAFRYYNDIRPEITDQGDEFVLKNGIIKLSDPRIITTKGAKVARTKDDITILITCFANQFVTAAEFELRIWTSSGHLLSSILSRKTQNRFDVPAGKSQIKIGINDIPLPPGKYRIAAGVKKNGAFLGWSRNLCSLEITTPDNPSISDGLVALDCSAEITQLA